MALGPQGGRRDRRQDSEGDRVRAEAIINARDSIIAFLGDLVDELTSLDVSEEVLA